MNNWSVNYKVSPELIEMYGNLFKDYHPIHTNDQVAKQLGFEKKVVYGNILGGFISHFVGIVLEQNNSFLIQQKITFTLPVYANDELTLEVNLYQVFDSVRISEYKFIFFNQNMVKVAQGSFQCISK